jgi:hypothetical protein
VVIAVFLGTCNATAALRALSMRTASALAKPANGMVQQRFLQRKAGRLQGRGNRHQIRQSKSTKAGEAEVAAGDAASSTGPKPFKEVGFKDDPKVILGALAGGFAFSFAYINWMLDNAEDEQQVDRMWDAVFENEIFTQNYL